MLIGIFLTIFQLFQFIKEQKSFSIKVRAKNVKGIKAQQIFTLIWPIESELSINRCWIIWNAVDFMQLDARCWMLEN